MFFIAFLLFFITILHACTLLLLGCRQAVRQRFLVPLCGGSIPPIPALFWVLNFSGKIEKL
ncbi:Protein of unknown function [Anaplasma phagocytophilum]|uniref:Uncharacterized protein n=1 Tax=Anaplasma phagocytophilum TaxID=948 RepID=A0A098EGN4_ANAPH|nr:Protein of unknown function [Anaplasma phagocytophilum]